MLRHDAPSSASDAGPFQPADLGLTPSQLLQQGERTERRRMLVSDILRAYVQRVERYGMRLQREVFERSLRGQEPADAARELGLKPQRVYEHQSRAFEWIAAEVQRRDPRDSVLGTVFGNRPATHETPNVPPRRLHDSVHWVVDELGALCPGEQRREEYLQQTDAPGGSDIRYHVQHARWYPRDHPHLSGCRLCQAK